MRIRRCTVRAIVREPWLFADPGMLTRALTGLLTELIVHRMAAETASSSGAPATIESVTVRVTVPASALAGLAAAVPAGVAPGRGTGSADHLELSLSGVRAAVSPIGADGVAAARLELHRAVSLAVHDALTEAVAPSAEAAGTCSFDLAAAVSRALLRAHRGGHLNRLLEEAGPDLVMAWTRLLALPVPWPDGAPPPPGAPTPAGPDTTAGSALGAMIVRLTAEVAAADRLGIPAPAAWQASSDPAASTRSAGRGRETHTGAGPPSGAATGSAPEASPRAGQPAGDDGSPPVPVPGIARSALPGPRRGTAGGPPWPGVPEEDPRGAPGIAPRRPSEPPVTVPVASVLPFLLLEPLRRIGVMDAVAAVLAGPAGAGELVAFAAALARKALPPPVRGWLHDPVVTGTVAAFAGGTDLPGGPDSERLARAVPTWWPPVRRLVLEELTGERPPEWPLLVVPSGDGFAVADSAGVFPVALDAGAAEVDEVRRAFGRPPVEAASPPLADFAAESLARPASGRAGFVPEVDAPIGVLAGVAMATLAWQLWRDHEDTHPVLALRRFADLDGTVRFEPDRVTVRIPLGRRHADLRDRGALSTVTDVPWLEGRPLDFTGG